MTEGHLYDASSLFRIIREHLGEAPGILRGGSTIPLVYYEIGNTIWKLCTKLKQVRPDEAQMLLETMFLNVRKMDTIGQEDITVGRQILEAAVEQGLTYYDAAYLVAARISGKTLVTDDKELARSADLLGVENVRSAEIF